MPDEPIQPERSLRPVHRLPGRPEDAPPREAARRHSSDARPTKEELRRRLRAMLPAPSRPAARPDEPPDDTPGKPTAKDDGPPDVWLEWDKPDPAPAGDPAGEKHERRGSRGISQAAAWLGIVVFAVLLAAASGISYWAGVWAERNSALAAATKEQLSVAPGFAAKLDEALLDLRSSRSRSALASLLSLQASNPTVSSLSYLVGIAAMQSGDLALAEKMLNESIARRERVSDSLAVLAAIEGQKAYDPTFRIMGDARMRSEIYLNRAMLADAANPFPLVEMASLLRSQKRNADSLRMLQSARSRLTPIDSHSVVDATIALLSLEESPDNALPSDLDPGKDIPSAFSAAYVAMRKGDFPRAADILKQCRRSLPPDLYSYILSDPALRKYAAEPLLAEFFR